MKTCLPVSLQLRLFIPAQLCVHGSPLIALNREKKIEALRKALQVNRKFQNGCRLSFSVQHLLDTVPVLLETNSMAQHKSVNIVCGSLYFMSHALFHILATE